MWSAVVTYLVMSMAGWALPQDRATVLLTFLAVLFAVYGVLSGVALETTRAVAAAARDDHAPGPALWRIAAVVSVCSVVAVLVLAPFWSERVLHDGGAALLPALAVAVGGYAIHCVLVGAAAGRAWWHETALVIVGEATLRLLVTVVVVLAAASVTSMGVASATGAFAWLALVARPGPGPRCTCAPTRGLVLARRIAAALVAQGASAVLVVGFPVLLAATTSRAEYAEAAPLLLAISLTRAPVLLPLNALQGVAVSHLVRAGGGWAVARATARARRRGRRGRRGRRLARRTLVAHRALRRRLRRRRGVLAVLTLAAGGTAALTLTGACAQALAAYAGTSPGGSSRSPAWRSSRCPGRLRGEPASRWRSRPSPGWPCTPPVSRGSGPLDARPEAADG